MDMKTRKELMERQRQYVKDHEGCTHLVACAITDEDKERATEIVRSGNAFDAGIAMVALTGPCLHKES